MVSFDRMSTLPRAVKDMEKKIDKNKETEDVTDSPKYVVHHRLPK